MITGDHQVTATAVARELGIHRDGDLVVNGEELGGMSQDELEEIVERVSVYARVSPMDKLKIVRAWKAKGQVVAMTGDGVNDAPALKHADIGVAMGIAGTDVAREAADMVLADDNFATIVSAIRQGRWIYDNIKKYLAYLLESNIAEVVVIGGIVLLLGPAYMPLASRRHSLPESGDRRASGPCSRYRASGPGHHGASAQTTRPECLRLGCQVLHSAGGDHRDSCLLLDLPQPHGRPGARQDDAVFHVRGGGVRHRAQLPLVGLQHLHGSTA